MRAGQAGTALGLGRFGRSSNCSSLPTIQGQVRIALRRALWVNSNEQPWTKISHLPSFEQRRLEMKDTSLGEGWRSEVSADSPRRHAHSASARKWESLGLRHWSMTKSKLSLVR